MSEKIQKSKFRLWCECMVKKMSFYMFVFLAGAIVGAYGLYWAQAWWHENHFIETDLGKISLIATNNVLRNGQIIQEPVMFVHRQSDGRTFSFPLTDQEAAEPKLAEKDLVQMRDGKLVNPSEPNQFSSADSDAVSKPEAAVLTPVIRPTGAMKTKVGQAELLAAVVEVPFERR